MKKRVIYLDHAATTYTDPEVMDAMLPFFTDHFYNPSSNYTPARKCASAVQSARETVAELLGAKDTREIIFTGGGSESDNDIGRVMDNLRKMEEALENMPGVKLIKAGGIRTPVLSVTFKNWSVEDAGFVLQESFNIITRWGLHCAPLIHRYIGSHPDGTLRLSLSVFNTADELDYVIRAFEKLVKS